MSIEAWMRQNGYTEESLIKDIIYLNTQDDDLF